MSAPLLVSDVQHRPHAAQLRLVAHDILTAAVATEAVGIGGEPVLRGGGGGMFGLSLWLGPSTGTRTEEEDMEVVVAAAVATGKCL